MLKSHTHHGCGPVWGAGVLFTLIGAVSVAASPAVGNEAGGEPAVPDQVSPVPSSAEVQPFLVGDFNLNHTIDLDDVTACALARQDQTAYFQTYPTADTQILNAIGDFTGDGLFDERDIEPYKTFIIAELMPQQAVQEKPVEPAKPLNSVVWVNNKVDNTLPTDLVQGDTVVAELGTDIMVPPAFEELVQEIPFTTTQPTRTSTGSGSGAKVFTASGNGGGGGGGGGGGASVVSGGGGGGGGGGSGGGGGGGANIISGGSGATTSSKPVTSGNTVTNQNSGGGSVVVVGGGSTGVVVAGGKPTTDTGGQTDTGGGTSASGGQDNTELRNPAAAVAPIEHEPYFRGERELFGYAPRYEPNPVAFDPDNKPYIRVAGTVRTQGNNGNWIDLPIADSITHYYQSIRQNLSFSIPGGQFIDQRITFDSRGDAYTIVKIVSGSNHWWFLLHSRDKCVSWDVYPLPASSHVRIEFNDGHNTLTQPPAVLVLKDKYLGLILPTRNSDGTLHLPKTVTVSNDSLLVPNHSGGANSAISVGGQVFVVYPLAGKWQQFDGTSQFVMAFDRDTGKVTTPQTFLGNVGAGTPDSHYLPAITADSTGVLHVVLGCHHDNLYYLKSLTPADASEWTQPNTIGKTVTPMRGGYTYPSLLCDTNDQLHVVARWAGDYGYKFELSYLRGDAKTGIWQEQKTLVSPFRAYYSIWYQHLSMDRRGRLFLNYWYYGNQLSAEDIAAYRQKWPEDGVPATAKPYPQQPTIPQVKPHDPAMLFSGNGGGEWRLATSPDLFTDN